MSEVKGARFNEGKPRLDLLPLDALRGVADVFEYGARKYAENNWRGGMLYSTMLASTLRHLLAFQVRENHDQESELHHIDHAITNLLMLRWFIMHGMDHLDDRWDGTVPDVPGQKGG